MSTKLLRDVGEGLYGPRWQSNIAHDLGVSDRTIRRWASGVDDVPPGVYMDLLRIVVERQSDLDLIVERLKREGAPKGG